MPLTVLYLILLKLFGHYNMYLIGRTCCCIVLVENRSLVIIGHGLFVTHGLFVRLLCRLRLEMRFARLVSSNRIVQCLRMAPLFGRVDPLFLE